MNKEEVEQYINALELRERVIAHLAIFVGMRPGEILALQRRHVSGDCSKAQHRAAPLPRRHRHAEDDQLHPHRRHSPKTASRLKEWMELVRQKPEAWVFASENPATPMWRDNVWYRHMKPKLETVGLEMGDVSGAAQDACKPRPRCRDRSESRSRPARARHRRGD